MRRIAVVGPTAAGKSTLASALASRVGCPRLELDEISVQAGWTALPPDELRKRVGEFVARDRWVVDGNYAVSRDLVLERADTVLWLRPSRWSVMRNVISRTSKQLLFREELWNGNRQSLRNTLSLDPDRSMIAVAWKTYSAYDREYADLRSSAAPAQRWMTFSSRRDVKRFVAGLEPG